MDLFSAEEGDLFGLRQESGDTLVSRNVIGVIPGYDAALKEHYIVVGARLDNVGTRIVNVDGEPREVFYPGAAGNGSGLAMLAELARMLSESRVNLRRSVLLCGFGAGAENSAGSWYFLNRSFRGSKQIDAMVNLDMLGVGEGFYAYCGSDANLESLLEEVSGTLQPARPELVRLEPVASDHRSFQNYGIPAVHFTCGMYPEYNSPADKPEILDFTQMERELEYIFHFCGRLANYEKKKYNFSEQGVVPFAECDYKPTFLGSADPADFLKKWVYVYMKYPEKALDAGIQGRVLVDFTIGADGKVRDVKVVRSANELLDEEAVRIISASPDWKPGRVRGRRVSAGLSLYVEFRLEKKK